MKHRGLAEIARLKRRLDATFERIKELDASPDLEVRSDLARYLCILVSGYLEKAVVELILSHTVKNGSPTVQRFVDLRTRQFTNAKSKKIEELLGSFSAEWGQEIGQILDGELKDAVDGIVDLRNTIAHGGTVGVTYQRVSDYYIRVQEVVDHVAGVCKIS